MQKYRWSLYKTLEFLNSRRPDLEIRAAFVSQLADFEQKLIQQNRGPQTINWNEVADKNIVLNQDEFHPDEELLLRNTFLNAHLHLNKSHNDSNIEPEKPAMQLTSNKHKESKIDNKSQLNSKLKWIDNYNPVKDEVIF